MKQDRWNRSIQVLIFISFSIVVFSLTSQVAWADIAPVISNSNQPATRTTSDNTSTIKDRDNLIQEEEEPIGWFQSAKTTLQNDVFEAHPRYRSEYVLDNNILLENDDKKLDSIFIQKPGLEVKVPFDKHLLKADYEADIERFVKFSRENDENQYFRSEANFNFTDLYINLYESLTQTSSRSATTFTDRSPRFEHDVDAEMGYKFNRFTLEGGYGSFYRSMDNTIQKHLNYHTNEWKSALFMDLTEKTKIFVDYAFTKYNYVKVTDRDGEGHQVDFGIEGALFPKTTLYSKFGYERIHYEAGRNGSDNFISEVGILYKPLTKTAIDLGYQRDTLQATFANTDDYLQDKVFARIRQRFTPKISGEADAAYLSQDYSDFTTTGAGSFTGERNDDLFTFDFKMLYQFTEWFGTDIEYQYARRDSNAPLFDYTNHILTVGAELKV